MGVKFYVEFNHSDKVYHPGEILRCKVFITLTKRSKIRCISARAIGFCETSWGHRQASSVGEDQKKIGFVDLTGQEIYFSQYREFNGKRDGPEFELEEGEYSYVFDYALPKTLPSSFEAKTGYVRYEFRIRIQNVFAFDKNHKELISIVTPLDLNQYPRLRSPVTAHTTETLGGGCCGRNIVKLSLVLPRAGYVPGDAVPVAIDDSDIYDITIKLMHELTFLFRQPYKSSETTRKKIVEFSYAVEVKARQKKAFGGELIIPPNYIVPNLTYCDLIESEYVIVVSAKVRYLLSVLECELGMTMGNIPLSDVGRRKSSIYAR